MEQEATEPFSLIALAMGEYGEAGRGCLNESAFKK
jgi:hypothetical protein